MSKAFVDTTILVDALIGPPRRQAAAKLKLKFFTETQVPVYAFKEMRAGPLSHLVYTYNLLASRATFEEVTTQLSVLGQFQSRRFSVGMTSLVNGLIAAGCSTQSEEDKKRSVQAWLLREIQKAWMRRRKLTTKVVSPLACFSEGDYQLQPDGRLRSPAGLCSAGLPCSAALHLKGREKQVSLLVEALRPKKGEAVKKESSNRRHALKEVAKRRAGEMPKKYCRALGDAYICIMAPQDAQLLTTNLSDFEPLAKALGKRVAP
jgi:predicted nucleic acid-binding protein